MTDARYGPQTEHVEALIARLRELTPDEATKIAAARYAAGSQACVATNDYGDNGYVYKRTEPELWTVGWYGPAGTWHPDSDHSTPEAAAERVRYLNGGPTVPPVQPRATAAPRLVRVAPFGAGWSWQCLVPGCRQAAFGLDSPGVAWQEAAGHPCSNPVAAGTAVTDPAVLTVGVEQGWADRQTDPTGLDWAGRQAAALVPYTVQSGRPVTPGPKVGRYGRSGLGRWGENPMADAIVTTTYRGVRHLLMVERGDGQGWAVPGGSIEPGETPLAAAVRELAEETGLTVSASNPEWRPLEARWVPDPRGTDESWAVTVPHVADLGVVDRLPVVAGGDDAAHAAWILAVDYGGLVAALDARGGRVFTAHTPLLDTVLAGGAW